VLTTHKECAKSRCEQMRARRHPRLSQSNGSDEADRRAGRSSMSNTNRGMLVFTPPVAKNARSARA
jgi:hypothetical protein